MNRNLTVSMLLAAFCAAPAWSQVEGHHDQTSAQYQATFDSLSGQGYRPIALSIYGTVGDERYASVWVQRAGPDWIGFHGLDGTQYQNLIDTECPNGFVPKILTATGSAANPRFAGVLEQAGYPCYALHGLDSTQFWDERSNADDVDYQILTADVYGDNGDSRYVVAYAPKSVGQTTLISGDGTTYQGHFDVMSAGHARPHLIATNDHGRYLSLWRSDNVGAWVSHHGMTSAEYQANFDLYGLQGWYPITVQASGSGAGAFFAATWAATDLPTPGSLTITGQAVPQLDAFDDWVENWMTDHEIRAASLAVVKQARLVYARGYTLTSDPGYPITQPDSEFRIASATKPITSIAIHQHFQGGAPVLNETDLMMSFFPGTVPLDARCNTTTIYDLLVHGGGWNRDVSGDPMSGDTTVAAGLGINLPVDKTDIFQWYIENTMLDFTPGTDRNYSNFGYNILGQIIEAANNGMPYETYVRRNIFLPIGISRPTIAGSMFTDLKPGEVLYHPYTPWFTQSVNSNAQPDVAGQYGGRNLENRDANGGWVMAAPDYAKLLGQFDRPVNPILDAAQTQNMWTLVPGSSIAMPGWNMLDVDDGAGGTVEMYYHNGRLTGSRSLIVRRDDGYSFVFFCNGDKTRLGGDQAEELSDIANTITLWPNHDLFPSVGLPSCAEYTPGAFRAMGSGCAGALTGVGTPDIGQFVDFQVNGVAPLSPTFIMIGMPAVPTPLDVIGMTGCTLYVNPLVNLAGVSNGAGDAVFPWQLPDSQGMIGLGMRIQSATIAPGANPLGLTLTRALNMSIGGWQ